MSNSFALYCVLAYVARISSFFYSFRTDFLVVVTLLFEVFI